MVLALPAKLPVTLPVKLPVTSPVKVPVIFVAVSAVNPVTELTVPPRIKSVEPTVVLL